MSKVQRPVHVALMDWFLLAFLAFPLSSWHFPATPTPPPRTSPLQLRLLSFSLSENLHLSNVVSTAWYVFVPTFLFLSSLVSSCASVNCEWNITSSRKPSWSEVPCSAAGTVWTSHLHCVPLHLNCPRTCKSCQLCVPRAGVWSVCGGAIESNIFDSKVFVATLIQERIKASGQVPIDFIARLPTV